MLLKVVENVGKVGRKMRRPVHHFSLRTQPWQIQPMMIAPVLPGDTMKNLLLQSRVVSAPLKSALVGWWSEYYFFYVKHRDFPDAESALMQNMHLDPSTSLASITAAADSLQLYTAKGTLNVVNLCLRRVVEDYFRNEGEAWDAVLIGGMPIASVGREHWFESARRDAAPAPAQDHEMPGEVNVLPYGIDPSFAPYYAQWENMRALNLTTKSFEDYLAAFGIKTPEVQEDENRVELLRYIREWSYPSNTINPVDGTPSTAMSWSHSERADKDRFFSEPGYIFGVAVQRPKVYFGAQKGNAAAMLDNAYLWLPPAADDQGWTSLKKTLAAQGPLHDAMGGDYWVDLRDLYLWGDQFVNYDILADGTGSAVALPSGGSFRYANAAMADALFKVAAANKISSDGIVSLSILSRVGSDQT